ncbi:hypothetical protein LPJ66_006770 [Kickxella alabastrina]|uniref:Uncharacterized protein n=1 Tax=Kickxella alabastrina TaxID=61397 RepID=A0ACC1IAS1_9FUNG|nr:hypothetical protein LPJ66_006770 [Kickxella alabastrina]
MSDIGALVSKLSTMGFSDPPVEHAAVDSVDQWAEALSTVSGLPSKYTLTKTLIFKPKQPKSEAIAPVVVIAKDVSATNSKTIGTELKLKDLRFASDDVLSGIFQTAKGSVSPFALAQVPKENIGNVRVVIDKALLNDTTGKIAFHPLDSSRTVFISSETLKSFIKSVEGLTHVTEMDFAAAAAAPAAAPAAAKSSRPAAAAAPAPKAEEVSGTKLGLDVTKEGDFSTWYRQMLMKAEMYDNYPISGCFILRPLAYFIWQEIQKFLDAGIMSMGVKNSYFPMFIPGDVLEREKDHIEGFAPEVAWVTRAGSTELAEPIAIRPTSETVMYPYFAKWIRSHRDLPLKLNQWCSVVRWEFKNPTPFLRTREFLWQEGHCAHLTKDGAMTEVREILTLYRRVYEELLAVPVIEGVKSENEKFAGGDATTTVEGFIPATGRGIQGGTSHYLGQNFSTMFKISVEDPESTGADRPKLFVHQTSWGLSTRTIGVMAMIHGDNKGMVMPPRVAETQVVIVPCGLSSKQTDEERREIESACLNVEARLKMVGVRAEADLRENYTPGFKFSHWEMRGVPIRLEIGPKDLVNQSVTFVRRDTSAKGQMAFEGMESAIQLLLIKIHDEMLARARKEMEDHTKIVLKWADFVPALNNKCMVLIPWCERSECEDQIKARSTRDELQDQLEDEKEPSMGAKSLCLPYKQPENPPLVHGQTKCVQCGEDAKRYALFGRSY